MISDIRMSDYCRGYVTGKVHNPITGQVLFTISRRNIITYSAADIMARVLGGDTAYRPGYMGFVYGSNASPGAALIEPPVSRVQTWTAIGEELSDPGVIGNVVIAPLAAGPSYSVDGSTTYYTGNAVTLTAHSGARLEYGFNTALPYQNELADNDYFYQAILVTRLVNGSSITYLPFARVSLKEGSSYPQKATGFELALFWQISYF
jgi:hypothetical protein